MDRHCPCICFQANYWEDLEWIAQCACAEFSQCVDSSPLHLFILCIWLYGSAIEGCRGSSGQWGNNEWQGIILGIDFYFFFNLKKKVSIFLKFSTKNQMS